MQTDRLFYVSVATRPHDAVVVRSILETARRKNARRDVTGCLLYSGLYFAQVLEGRTDVITEMISELARDSRHKHIRILQRIAIAEREFASWVMGYMHSLGLQDALEILVSREPVDAALVESTRRAIRPDPLTGLI